MEDLSLGAVETRFADIIWDNEPLSSGELVKRCEKELSWKKSTTYTVLKKLCDKGIFANDGGLVRAKMTREEFAALRSERFVEETFNGSLPAFVAAFTSRKTLSDGEVEELFNLLKEFEEARG